jgi:hypothetical protein
MALPFAPPTSLSPGFVISHCVLEDVDNIERIYYDAFKEDPGNSHWWSPSRESMVKWMRQRVLKKMADNQVRHFKITDVQSGDLVAFARWDIPESSTDFGEWFDISGKLLGVSNLAADEPDLNLSGTAESNQEISHSAPAVEPLPKHVDIPEGANPILVQRFFGALAKASEKWYTKNMLGECRLSPCADM